MKSKIKVKVWNLLHEITNCLYIYNKNSGTSSPCVLPLSLRSKESETAKIGAKTVPIFAVY